MIPEIKLQYLDEPRRIFIGKQIAKRRKEKKYKACELADAIGIGKDQYSKIENGKVTCTIDNLFLIAQYLELDLNYLMYGKELNDRYQIACEYLRALDDEQLERVPKIIAAIFGA